MKLPLSWLREFVTVEADTDQIAHRLSMAGLVVEKIEKLRATFSGVVVAKVIKAERHPNADRLSLCEVDAGPAGQFKVVCGAPNVHSGMYGALAQVGARLGDAKPLEAAVIRGVRSEGMLCSERELGFSDVHGGIVELGADATPGAPVADYLQLEDT